MKRRTRHKAAPQLPLSHFRAAGRVCYPKRLFPHGLICHDANPQARAAKITRHALHEGGGMTLCGRRIPRRGKYGWNFLFIDILDVRTDCQRCRQAARRLGWIEVRP